MEKRTHICRQRIRHLLIQVTSHPMLHLLTVCCHGGLGCKDRKGEEGMNGEHKHAYIMRPIHKNVERGGRGGVQESWGQSHTNPTWISLQNHTKSLYMETTKKLQSKKLPCPESCAIWLHVSLASSTMIKVKLQDACGSPWPCRCIGVLCGRRSSPGRRRRRRRAPDLKC